MKKEVKKVSIYLLLLFLIATTIFSLNYFYGQQISTKIESQIRTNLEKNGYQLLSLDIKSNPLLRVIVVENLNFNKKDHLKMNINQANINFSWQQLLSYLRSGVFHLDKNLKSEINQLEYSSLKNNYKLKFVDSELNYQGDLNQKEISQLENFNDLNLLLDNNHNFVFNSTELKVDFPYYRSYGLNKENWDRLSTFKDFIIKADYDKKNQEFKLQNFDMSNDILKIIFDLNSKLLYLSEKNKLTFTEMMSNYNLFLAAEEIDFMESYYFKDLKLKQIDFDGDFNLTKNNTNYRFNQLNYNFNLNNLNLILSNNLSNYLEDYTLGVLNNANNLEILINKLNYQQEYSYPNGKSSGQLESSLINAELKAEYNYAQEIPYINNGLIKYKTKSDKAEKLNLFLQLILENLFNKDSAGYYSVEFWGPVNDLSYK